MITSTSNTRVKYWALLSSSKSARHKNNACILEGETMVREALHHHLITDILLKEDAVFDTADIPAGTAIHYLSSHCFKKISQLANVQVMAVAKLPHHAPVWDNYSRILICDHIQNPDNLGTLIRSAHGAEFDALITSPHSADLFSPKTLRASTGSALRFCCFQLALEEVFSTLSSRGFTIIGLDAQGDYNLFTRQPQGKVALVVGNEGQGISALTQKNIDATASLPLNPQVESLNASIAASIAMYQIRWGITSQSSTADS